MGAASTSLGRLVAARRRLEPDHLWPLLALVGGGVGFFIGLDLRGDLRALVDHVYFVSLALIAPLPMSALSALYHDELHARLLPLPVDGAAHFRIGVRLLAARQLPWLLTAVGVGVGAGWGAARQLQALLVTLSASIFVGGALASLGCAGIAAGIADLNSPAAERLRRSLAGPFTSQRHAPFLYLPALAFGAIAGAGLLGQLGVFELLAPRAAPRSYAMLAAPLVIGALLALAGAAAYRRAGLRAIARVVEESRTVYGGRPAPASPPYGHRLGSLLGGGALRAYFEKELRELTRVHRGLWAFIVLVDLVVLAYAVNVGDTLAAAPLCGVLLIVWIAAMPLRRRPAQMGAAMLRTLPPARAAHWGGRTVAACFVAAHVGAPVAATLWSRHGQRVALVSAALLLVTAALAVSATAPTSARSATAWRWPTRLAPAAALVVGVMALALAPLWAAVGVGGLAVFALLVGLS